MARKSIYDNDSNFINYEDPYFFGQLNETIEAFSTPLWVFVQRNPHINSEGTMVYDLTKYLIRGSLQDYRKKTTFGQDGAIISSRDGRLYTTYDVKFNTGDIVSKKDKYYKIIPTEDFDYAGVRQYDVVRLGYDEIVKYEFDKYLVKDFSTYIQSEKEK